MTLSLASMAQKMIEDRMIQEVRNQIRQKASSAFLASVLPSPDPAEDKASLLVRASLCLRIESLELDYTIHLGSDTRKQSSVPPEDLRFELNTSCPLRKPGDFVSDGPLLLSLEKLGLNLSLGGIGYRKSMAGMGVTVHGVRVNAVLSGQGTGEWREPVPSPKGKSGTV